MWHHTLQTVWPHQAYAINHLPVVLSRETWYTFYIHITVNLFRWEYVGRDKRKLSKYSDSHRPVLAQSLSIETFYIIQWFCSHLRSLIWSFAVWKWPENILLLGGTQVEIVFIIFLQKYNCLLALFRHKHTTSCITLVAFSDFVSLSWLTSIPGFAVTLPNVILCNGTKTTSLFTNDVNIRSATSVVCAFRRNTSKTMNKNEI